MKAAATASTEAAATLEVRAVFLGSYQSQAGKLLDCWYFLEGFGLAPIPNDGRVLDDTDTDRMGLYVPKRRPLGATPGTVLTFDSPAEAPAENRSIRIGTARNAGRWENQEQAAEWEARSRAVARAKAAEALAAKVAGRSDLQAALAPLRAAYLRLSLTQRAQLIGIVVAEMTGWGWKAKR